MLFFGLSTWRPSLNAPYTNGTSRQNFIIGKFYFLHTLDIPPSKEVHFRAMFVYSFTWNKLKKFHALWINVERRQCDGKGLCWGCEDTHKHRKNTLNDTHSLGVECKRQHQQPVIDFWICVSVCIVSDQTALWTWNSKTKTKNRQCEKDKHPYLSQ